MIMLISRYQQTNSMVRDMSKVSCVFPTCLHATPWKLHKAYSKLIINEGKPHINVTIKHTNYEYTFLCTSCTSFMHTHTLAYSHRHFSCRQTFSTPPHSTTHHHHTAPHTTTQHHNTTQHQFHSFCYLGQTLSFLPLSSPVKWYNCPRVSAWKLWECSFQLVSLFWCFCEKGLRMFQSTAISHPA